MSDIRCLEHPTLKVPYESLNKRFRLAQKTLEREVAHANAAVADVEKAIKDSDGSVKGFQQVMENLMEKVDNVKSKLSDCVSGEESAALSCRQRIDHLKQGCGTQSNQASKTIWRKVRVERMLVEHFLRSGFYNSAMKLAETADITHLTNIQIFLVAKEVEESLQAKDTSKCLAWCYDNKSKMRKMKSNLEFNVRLQEFIELVKQGRKLEAVKHARKHLSSASDAEQLDVVQTGMALLAFPVDTEIQPYKNLFKEDRWQNLIEQFRQENYRLFQLSNQSVFSVALQAGLSSLKTQKCTSRSVADRNGECPVCQEPLNELAARLPFAHCSQSRLICYISGKPLNEHNHPMMLPNGYVYGEQALVKMSIENDGQIVCPRTKEIFAFTDAEKVYVM